MQKLAITVLLIIFILAFGIVESHSEEIKACVGKTGQLRVVNDLSECNRDEQPRTFDTSINSDLNQKEMNEPIRTPDQFTLTIKKDGTGRGTVRLSPSGRENNSVSVQIYNKGTLVVLTALPDENSVFAGWKGDGCLGEGICILTMSSDKTVTATFHETNASGTVVIRNTEKSKVPAMNKRKAEQHEIKKDKKQTIEKPSQPQKLSETLYAVQVGAFRNASNAKAFQMKLAQKGYHAYILTSKSTTGGEFNKVLIGRFSERGKAENLSKKIFKVENLQAFVTLAEQGKEKLDTKQ